MHATCNKGQLLRSLAKISSALCSTVGRSSSVNVHVTLIQLQNDLVVAKPVQDTTNEDFDKLEHSSSLVFTPGFANVVNVDGLRIKDGKVFVIWKWQVLHPQDKTVIIVRGITVCFWLTEPRTIQTQSLKQSHTIPFKVIRCNYIQKYSEKQVYLLTKVSLYVYIEVQVEPDNPVTPNAIAL